MSLSSQHIWIESIGQHFEFDAWEPVPTEFSHEDLESDIASLAAAAGFGLEARFSDRRSCFEDSLWPANKG